MKNKGGNESAEGVKREIHTSTEEREDYFLQHPLKQPKAEIATYVESFGIPVPKRYSTAEEAFTAVSGEGKIIVRSEHPLEYEGVSGMFESVRFDASSLSRGQKLIAEGKVPDPNIYLQKGTAENDRWDVEYMAAAGMLSGTLSQEEFENILRQLDTRRVRHYAAIVGAQPEEVQKELSYSYWVQ